MNMSTESPAWARITFMPLTVIPYLKARTVACLQAQIAYVQYHITILTIPLGQAFMQLPYPFGSSICANLLKVLRSWGFIYPSCRMPSSCQSRHTCPAQSPSDFVLKVLWAPYSRSTKLPFAHGPHSWHSREFGPARMPSLPWSCIW